MVQASGDGLYAAAIDVTVANAELTARDALGRLRWAAERFGEGFVLLSSMQKTASVQMHLWHRLGLANDVLFVDTQYHFIETLKLRDRFMRDYQLNMVTLYPEMTPEQQERVHGRKLYPCVDGQPVCCRLRKELPLIHYLREKKRRVLSSGLRRGEGGKRAQLQPLMPDARFDGYVLHPIFDFSKEDVEAYLRKYNVPIHPLHAQHYPSIGCECCTTPVAPGEDARAGRWRHLRQPGVPGPQYCGINLSDGAGI